MSGKDKNTKFKQISENLYQIHGDRKKPVDAIPSTKKYTIPGYSQIIKSESLKTPVQSEPSKSFQVSSYQPSDISPKKRLLPAVPASQAVTPNTALNSLRTNLKNLNDLHVRLRFMLKELEDMVRE